MSDHAYFQLYVYELPTDQHPAFAALVKGLGLEREYGDATPAPLGKWVDEEARMNVVDEASGALSKMGASFECWQDPKYEYDGEYAAHFPQLGSWQGRCNSEGEPYLLASVVDEIVEKWIDETTTMHGSGLIEKLNDASGRPWRDRARMLAERMKEEAK